MRLTGLFAHDLPSGFRYGRHRHPHWEFIAIVGGHGRVEQGRRLLPFADGDVICNPPGQPHASYVEAGCRHLVLSGMGPLPATAAVLRAESELRRDLAQLDEEYRSRRPLREAMLEQLAGMVLLRLQRSLAQPLPTPTPAERIKAIIDRDYARPLDLAALAAAVGLSRERTRHCFQETYALSPNRYLAEVRLLRARDLLEAGARPVAKVAECCGFADPYYFSRCYRQRFGRPPSATAASSS